MLKSSNIRFQYHMPIISILSGEDMTTYVEINGMDESGSVGEPIIFVRIGVSLLHELQIILRNIEYFNKLMASKYFLKGYETSTLFKYVLDFINDPSLDITIFRMFPETQLKILRELSLLTGETLFQCRKTLTKMFDLEGNLTTVDQPTASEISKAVGKLKRFRNPKIWLESFIKSYGMMTITKRLGEISKSLSKPGFTDHFLVIQIDGGFPFAFWWKYLLNEDDPCFKKGSFVVNGISNGDNYYPSISTAGTIAESLFRNVEKLHLFPVYPIKYETTFDLNTFCEDHGKAMEMHTFQNRILFVGRIREGVRTCIPYLMHLRGRKKTYEPFGIRIPIKWFSKVHGFGTAENTVIVQGSYLSPRDKENLRFCKDNGYPIYHVSDFKESFEELINKLEAEIQYAPTQKRKSLSSKLKKIEEDVLSGMR